jgi:hypothetical protein
MTLLAPAPMMLPLVNMDYVDDKVLYAFPPEGTEIYDNYYSIFKETQESWWSAIKDSDLWLKLNTKERPDKDIDASKGETEDQKVIDEAVKKVSTNMKAFYGWYGSYVDYLYGNKSLMQTQYLENELTTTRIPNPAWLPMASEGTDITKDIVSYNEEITATTADYENAIIKANANINKLEAIKIEVSKIIQAAQKRRDDKIFADAANLGLTREQYLQKYSDCFDEENISFFEDIDIVGESSEERCSDNMDNDLDGKIDRLDPDCNSVYVGRCSNGETSSVAFNFPTTPCAERNFSTTCTKIPYYHSGNKTTCVWTGPGL